MGERIGVGQQIANPEVVSLSGTVLGIETGPCEKTTGRADVGSHFLLKTARGEELNIHLGPAATVNRLVERLPVGTKVTVDAFRTAKMPTSHYVAQSLTFDGTTIRLRDEGLRPFWAGHISAARGRGGHQYGHRRGRGWGRGWGRR